jgi:predicted  nucleic acid-binding Zn-ribbon protein
MKETRPTRPVLLDDDQPTSDPQDGGPELPMGHHLRNVYLRQPEAVSQARRLNWLARRLGLEHYSSKLLTNKVNIELSVLAALLVATFVFELGAWSFFFNGIFVGDMGKFDGGGTTAALVLALLFAGVILFFERQVIISDTLRMRDKARKRAQWIRVLSIIGAGFIVAHSVDLLAFNTPVEKRLHREAVHEEALRLAQDIEGLGGNTGEQKNTIAGDLAAVRGDLAAARQRREQVAGEQERYRQQAESLQSEARSHRDAFNFAEKNLARAEEGADTAAQRRAQRDLEAARRRSTDASSDLRAMIGNQSAATASLQEIDRLINQLTEEEGELRNKRAGLDDHTEKISQVKETLKSRLRLWFAELDRSDPGDRIEGWSGWTDVTDEEKRLWPERWRRPLDFKEPKRNFFEEIDCVYQLAFRWLNSSEEKRVELPTYLPAAGLREQRSSITYFFSWLGIHLAAMFVPFLVFAVKWFLMPKEIDAYFSAWHQAFAGDPEARTILRIEDEVRKKGELW